jgi:predicted TIM-barrel fold metal-dependent hydrolase
MTSVMETTGRADHEATAMPNIVSVDDHIVEPPSLWQDRLPARFRAQGLHVARELVGLRGVPAEDGDPEARWSDVWYYDGLRVPMLRIYASAGLEVAVSDGKVDLWQSDAIGMTYDEMRPGCYEPGACLADMDLNGVDASLGFPNLILRFCGQLFLDAPDKDLALLSIKAYNDWLRDEWERVGAGRLIGATIVPLWDADLAAAEVRRNAARGAKAVCFSEIPAWLGLPSIHGNYWDPFFAACAETRTVIVIHIGSSSTSRTTSDDAPPALSVTNLYTNSSMSLSDFLLSGVFLRFPGLKLAYAEAQAGWIPYIVERLDTMWAANHKYMRMDHLPEPPSTYYRGNIYSCVFDDRVAIERLLDKIGVDQLCFETDYPHADSSWPNSKDVARRNLAGLDAPTVRKIVRDNAIEMLQLDASRWPTADASPVA